MQATLASKAATEAGTASRRDRERIVDGTLGLMRYLWEFDRGAGYLAALYANDYIDVSLTVPLTAHGCTAAFSEALELAPYSKLMFATDAHSLPELFYVGALHGRRGLALALERLVADDIISVAQAEQAALAILVENAERLYRLAV